MNEVQASPQQAHQDLSSYLCVLLIRHHVKRDSQYLPLSILNVKTDLERKKEQPLRFCEKEFEGQEGE
jgi:hypothetical protein